MFGFGKKAREAKAVIQLAGKRDLMQAIVAGAVLVAFADGELEDSEVGTLQGVIESLPSLQGFGAEIGQTVDRYIGIMKASKHLGKNTLRREISDVKTSPQEAEDVFAVMMSVAEADGEIEPAEKAVLNEIARVLGVNAKDYGLTA